MPPRPEDPELAYARFVRHKDGCHLCAEGKTCPYGEELLLCWHESEDFYRAEQETIDAAIAAAFGDSDERLGHLREENA